jgi:hypothetical protein
MGVGRLIDRLFGGDATPSGGTLRAYGKLPIYAEYRRLELSAGTPTAFSQWLDAGRLAWVRSSSQSGAGATRPSRLVVGLSGVKEAIVASVWDSRDSLGRVFPFSFFVVCPPEALGRDPVERWAAASGIHRTFDRFYAQLHTLGSGGDFYRFYQKRTVALRVEDADQRVSTLREEAGKIAVEPWFKAVAWDGEMTMPAWFGGLVRRAERWKAPAGSLADMAISCPLARAYSYEAQAVLWLEWLGPFSRRIGKMPWLLVPAEGEPSALAVHLVFRDLLPDDYQLLTTDDGAYDYIEQLSSLPAGDTEATPLSADDTPSGSLLAWLNQHMP